METAAIAILLILVTEGALVASHVTWEHPWWRKPLLWSDRWHVLSALCHWPIVCFVLWQHVPPDYWLALAGLSWALWQLIKEWGDKSWLSVPAQVWHWMKGWWQ
jgi:hypothetical protein